MKYLGDGGIDWRIILKRIGFIWLRIKEESSEHSNKPLISKRT
jgi:hypothetical protein